MAPFLFLMLLCLSACSTGAQAQDAVSGASPQASASRPALFASAGMRLRLEDVARTDDVVWAMDFLSADTMIFTERRGRFRLLDLGSGKITPIAGGPAVATHTSGGLFDVLVDPDFAVNGYIYYSYIKPAGERSVTALGRGRLRDTQLTGTRDLFVANNASTDHAHWGSRIAMDAQRFLYVTSGDRHAAADAQSLSSHGGKILRLRADGRAPRDNPFARTSGAAAEIWSLGHRNPQGLAIHPSTGQLYEQEHGPTGGDEINLVRRGANYGWPVITWGENIGGGLMPQGTARSGMEQPLKYWVPGTAPTGIAFCSGQRYPGWRDSLFSATLRGPLHRLTIDNDRVIGEEILLENWQERVRDVAEGPDGLLYLATESGRIMRIVPLE
ncbi:MAG: PQQ-dependent sugar dehydrogenase [Gammaproteobacteria bacterium]|nr:PQQ-dependent sugar dehydrogenase [Gammaproteobacteria bacterium]